MTHHPVRKILFCALITATGGCTQSAAPTGNAAEAIACPSPTLFDNAVCSCEDLTHVGELHIEQGPGGSGSVGVNGATQLVGQSDISGTLTSWQGLTAVGCSIGDSLITPGDVEFTGSATINDNATVGGNLLAVGMLTVGGQLEVGGTSQMVGGQDVASQAPYQSPGQTPPCNCDPSTFFDVGAAVAAAKQAANGQSNWTNVGQEQLHLSTGSYYVTAAATVGSTAIVIDGTVSVFVDGSLQQVGLEQWKISPGAQLDLFVSGNVQSVGALVAGDASQPDAFRVYVGGSNDTSIQAVGTSVFYGAIYAPQANIQYVGDAHVVGAIFAKSILGVGSLTIDYGDQSAPPASCTPPPDGGSGSGSSGGTGDGSGIFL